MLLFMVMPALFGGFGKSTTVNIINTINTFCGAINTFRSVINRFKDLDKDIEAAENDAITTSEQAEEDYKTGVKTFKRLKKNPNLGSYLAGLIEGDGHIYVPR